MRSLVLGLACAAILVGCAGGPMADTLQSPGTSSPSPPQAASAAPTSATPSLDRSPDRSVLDPSPSPGLEVPLVGSVMVTISDALRVRSHPEVSDRSVRYEPLLPLGTELRVLEGPVEGSGYVWIRVAPMTIDLEGSANDGWVALGSIDGEPWIAAVPGPSPSPSPAPSVAPTPTVHREPTVSASWQRMDGPVLETSQYPYVATWTGDRFVLPSVIHEADPGRGDDVGFWTSADGVTWTVGRERSAGWVTDFAFDGSGAGVAVGFLEDSGAAWTSADGIRWTNAPDQAPFGPGPGEARLRMQAVAYGDGGYVAVGHALPLPVRGVVVTSTDGLTWTRLPTDPAFSNVYLDDIAGVDGHYLLVGHVRSPFRRVMWLSGDGRTWTELTPPAATHDLDESLESYQIVAGPSGVLLVQRPAYGLPTPVDQPRAMAWTSTDGRSWSAALVPPTGQLIKPQPLFGAPWGYLAITMDSDCRSNLWAGSSDATDWACIEGGTDWPLYPSGEAVAASDAVVLVGGAVGFLDR